MGILAFASLAGAQTASTSRLVNLSVRTKLAAGDGLIVGFVITGSDSDPARMLVRGVGPALGAFGIADAMPNPKITLSDARGGSLENDDWGPPAPDLAPPSGTPVFTIPKSGVNVITFTTSSDTSAPLPEPIAGAFPLPANSRDASLLVDLKPGGYSLKVSGSTSADSGTVLAELYDARTRDQLDASGTRLVNMSAQGVAGPGAPLIAGFVVEGTASKRLLLRAVGPALTLFKVVGAATDTRLDLMDQKGNIIALNDNWDAGSAADTLEVRQATTRTGAFALPAGSRDAAVLVTVPPGLYTLRGSGLDGVKGTVLLEIYELPN